MNEVLRTGTPGRAASNAGARAFTLIELLVVIAIIALLVGIMVPVVQTALAQAEAARTRARVVELQTGCYGYRNDYSFFPGQRHWDQLGTVESSKTTGSQWIVLALKPKKYATFKSEEVIDVLGLDSSSQDIDLPDSASDLTSDPMAILYFPAKLGVKGMAQYSIDHNIEYIRGHGNPTTATFNNFIKDQLVTDQHVPHNEQNFLLIAPGTDRLYLNPNADITWPHW